MERDNTAQMPRMIRFALNSRNAERFMAHGSDAIGAMSVDEEDRGFHGFGVAPEDAPKIAATANRHGHKPVTGERIR